MIAEVLTNDGNGHGLYQTVSGSYVIDDSGLSVGSATTDPTILITQKVVRGKTTASNYEFTQTPTGIVFDVMAVVVFITKIQKGIGLRIV